MGRLEDSVSKRTQALLDSLKTTTEKLDRLTREILVTTETSSSYWNGVQRQVRALYEDLRLISAEWANYNVPIVYREQMRLEVARLKARRFDTKATVDYRSFVSSNAAKQSLSALLGEINSTWFSGYQQGQRTLIRLSRLTQQYLVRESQIEKALERGYLEGGPGVTVNRNVGRGSLYGSQRSLYEEFRKKAVDGKFITVVDKNGNPIQYTIKAYTELVARTKMVEASSQAVINTTTAMGEDLVQWSVHNTICPVCAQYEGKIYSLSGKDPDFPVIEEIPPAHPHCYHVLSTVIKEGLVADGTLEKYSAFSRGDTEEHPTRKGWVPVSERNIA